MFVDAKAACGIQALAVFVAMCDTYATVARKEIGLRVCTPRPEPVPDAPMLSTAREAAAALGPSFTARKVYRLTPNLPHGCAVRKGGRLYYNLPTLREWAARQ